MTAVTPLVPMLAVVGTVSAAADSNAVPQLVKKITSDPLPSRREDAAIQLVNRTNAQDQIDTILKNPDNPSAQAAVAKAIAKSTDPNPANIGDLGKLLGPNSELTEAAATALASINFSQHPEIFDYLRKFADDSRNPEIARAKLPGRWGQSCSNRWRSISSAY